MAYSNLKSKYEQMGNPEKSGNITRAIDQVCSRTTDLRKQVNGDFSIFEFFNSSGWMIELLYYKQFFSCSTDN